jgi:hypothetical protein
MDYQGVKKMTKKNICVDITQEQAEALLQMQLGNGQECNKIDLIKDYYLMAKPCDSDRKCDDYLELSTDDLEEVSIGGYTHFQLWSREV